MPSTTDTRDRTRRAPGAAFDIITGALAGLYDTATEQRAESAADTAAKLLVAADVAALVPSCRHMVCTVAAQLDRQAGA